MYSPLPQVTDSRMSRRHCEEAQATKQSIWWQPSEDGLPPRFAPRKDERNHSAAFTAG
jgi:hypothetical protein